MKRLNEIFSKGEVLLNVTYDSFNKELVLLCKHPETEVKKLYSLKDPYIPIYIADKEPKHHLDYIEKNKDDTSSEHYQDIKQYIYPVLEKHCFSEILSHTQPKQKNRL